MCTVWMKWERSDEKIALIIHAFVCFCELTKKRESTYIFNDSQSSMAEQLPHQVSHERFIIIIISGGQFSNFPASCWLFHREKGSLFCSDVVGETLIGIFSSSFTHSRFSSELLTSDAITVEIFILPFLFSPQQSWCWCDVVGCTSTIIISLLNSLQLVQLNILGNY